jgi:hypothetical protein
VGIKPEEAPAGERICMRAEGSCISGGDMTEREKSRSMGRRYRERAKQNFGQSGSTRPTMPSSA